MLHDRKGEVPRPPTCDVSLRINLITSTWQSGVQRDAMLLQHALAQQGHRVTITSGAAVPRSEKLRRELVRRFLRRKSYDINIHIEIVNPHLMPYARVNCLLPNQEWTREDVQQRLHEFDCVLCKTRHAEEIFSGLGCRTYFLGFISEDRRLPAMTPNFTRHLHVAGRSRTKGTRVLTEAWARHPDWPCLIVVQDESIAEPIDAPNIDYRLGHMPDDELRQLQNQCGIHWRPTEMEGFGHCIVEAMSCAAVPVVTDAPPMNELVDISRGILLPYTHSEPHLLGKRFFVQQEAIQAAMATIINCSPERLIAIGKQARGWFEAIVNDYAARLTTFVASAKPSVGEASD